MRGVSIKAVATALVATIGLDIVAGVTLTQWLGGDELAALPVSDTKAREAALMALAVSPAFLGWIAVLGTLTTVLGGYLAARLAEQVPYMNALAFGLAGTALTLLSLLTTQPVPLWYAVFGMTVSVPAALVGGHIAKRRLP